ncbi:MAG: Mrp/NBP35 family ATP-binding protein, partial [Thermoanaerobaculia bacterium]
EKVKDAVEQAVRAVPEMHEVKVNLNVTRPPTREEAAQKAIAQDASLIPDVKHVVAVASGKGGVGKSTVAANLAVKLGQLGYRVGLLDADIYGPSVPMMFGITDKPRVDGNRIIPFQKYGIKVMSLGFILETDTPVIWRGPMVMRAIEQMLGDVEWGALDYMILDLPPGTGDAQLTVTQRIPLAGAVIVTTPQDVALIDARKGLAMFRKVNVPVIGIVENMSTFVCPHCGEETHIFKEGGGRKTAELLETAFLGAIPLDPKIVLGGDAGVPITVAEPRGPHAQAFRNVAEAVVEEVAQQEAARPKLSIV